MMMKSLGSGAVLAALQLSSGALAQSLPAALADFCAAVPNTVVQVFVTEQLVEFNIGINTFINENTNLIINNNNINNFIDNSINIDNTNVNVNPITININNAPTQIITNILGTSTATVTSTVTTTATAAPTATSGAADTFLLNVVDIALARRQNVEGDNIDRKDYVAANGRTTRDCSRASRFQIINNELFQEGSRFSIAPQSRSSIFAASFSGNITTTFSLTNGRLQWANTAFAGGFAFFCRIPFGQLNSVFQGEGPAACGRVFFVANTVQSCVSNNTSSASGSGSGSASGSALPTSSASASGNGTSSIRPTNATTSGAPTATGSSGLPTTSANATSGLPTSGLPTGTATGTLGTSTSVTGGTSTTANGGTSTSATGGTSTTAAGGTSTTANGGTSTSATDTTTAPTTTATVGPTAAPFAIQAIAPRVVRKRQLFGGFLNAAGVLTSDPTAAANFRIVAGQLLQNGLLVSTSAGIGNLPFAPRTPIGSILTTWTSSTTAITWSNASFVGGTATYCVQLNNQINIVFDALFPAGCTPVLLQPVAINSTASSTGTGSTTRPVTTTSLPTTLPTTLPTLLPTTNTTRLVRARATKM